MYLPNIEYSVDRYRDYPNRDSDYWQFSVNDAKLVYFPYNYLGNDNKQGYYFADFAIFEVDFGNETAAKLFTRDFYGKYDREKGTKRDKALNFFARPLAERYTSQQLLEQDPKIWMAGYPAAGMSHKASTNYNLDRQSPSRYTYLNSPKGKDGRKLLGHEDSRKDPGS